MTTVGLVTGAASGMGRACAERIGHLVDIVVLVDRDASTLDEVSTELVQPASTVNYEPFPLDIVDADGLAALAARLRELGTLRLVAHAAGVSPVMADWRRILTIDLVGTAMVVERHGRVTGYTTGIGFAGHTVGETNEDLKALIASAQGFGGPGFHVPNSNGELLRWCYDHGLQMVKAMTLMTLGMYNEPQGAYLPSVFY